MNDVSTFHDEVRRVHGCSVLLSACAAALLNEPTEQVVQDVRHVAEALGDLSLIHISESDISKRLSEANGGDVLYEDLGLNPSLYYIGLKETEAMPVASAIHRGGNVMKPYEG